VRFTPQDEQFRAEVRAWLDANLAGEFAGLRGAGGPGREHERHAERLAWNRHLAAAGWTCLGWPAEFGGRGATLDDVFIHFTGSNLETGGTYRETRRTRRSVRRLG